MTKKRAYDSTCRSPCIPSLWCHMGKIRNHTRAITSHRCRKFFFRSLGS